MLNNIRKLMMMGVVGSVGLGLGLLSGCSQPLVPQAPSSVVVEAPRASGIPSNIPIVSRSVAVAEQTLTLLETAALGYATLPRCGTGVKICSDKEVVRKIRAYAIQAHNALVIARQNETMVERVWVAIGLLRSVIPS